MGRFRLLFRSTQKRDLRDEAYSLRSLIWQQRGHSWRSTSGVSRRSDLVFLSYSNGAEWEATVRAAISKNPNYLMFCDVPQCLRPAAEATDSEENTPRHPHRVQLTW